MSRSNKVTAYHSSDGQILNLTLNAPQGNILDIRMITELTTAIDQMANSPEVKAIVFRGEGEHFSYGASIPEHGKELVAELLARFHDFFRTLIRVSKPCIAVVRGHCLGGGLELAGFCHWMFASEDACFGQPEIKLGVFPPVASLVLPYRVGQSAAERLVLTGESITAAEAQKIGLVHSVAREPEDELNQFLSEHILPKSSVALAFATKSSRFRMHCEFLRDIEQIERIYLRELMDTEDANEGVRAFLEKRTPAWKNR